MKTIKLYYHKTNGGAEYLCSSSVINEDLCECSNNSGIIIHQNHILKKDVYINCKGRTNEGSFNSEYIIRIDGNIKTDAELTIKSVL